MHKFLLIILSLLFCQLCHAEPYPLTIESRHEGSDILLIAHNNGYSTVSIKASLVDEQNLSSDHIWPMFAVLPASRDTTLARMYAADKNHGFKFNTSVVTMLGDFNAVHDASALYRLPYEDGKSYSISQAIGSERTTHTNALSLYAVDFNMPQGTPVVAARDGIVTQVVDGYTQGGNIPALADKANSIRIQHADGTTASYVHLMPGGDAVRTGQRVKAGEVIGYSGSTGYSSGPHLHFAVTQLVKKADLMEEVSIPFSFYVGNPAYVFEPRKGLNPLAYYDKPGEAPSMLPSKMPSKAVAQLPAYNISNSSSGFQLSLVDYAALLAIAIISLFFVSSGNPRTPQRK